MVLDRNGTGGEQRLRRAEHEPEREQAIALWAADRVAHQREQARLRRRGHLDHATSRATAAATSAAVMSRRQRGWPSGHVAVPVAEQGRHGSSRWSTALGAR